MAPQTRVDPFAAVDEDLDLSGLDQARPPKPKPDMAKTRNAAVAMGFKSREPVPAPATPAAAPPTRRSFRRAKTTKEQFNLRAERADIDLLCQIAADRKWLLGDAFGEAVAALAEKLAS